jgi:PIN domain nuclease of toxin-antitoxin system
MNYLLDTHTFLWTLSSVDKLSKKAIEVIKNPKNEIFVSAVTLWEISIKVRLNKLNLDTIHPDELINLAERMEFQMISLSPEEAASYYKLSEVTHNDPFDRMLIWQSISRKMTLISKDKEFNKFSSYGLKFIW